MRRIGQYADPGNVLRAVATGASRSSPQMRFAIVPFCNLKCFYCSPEGEGYSENLKERMTRPEIACLTNIAAEVGITHVKVTGGEPLLRKDVVGIISDLASTPGIEEVQMVTNGTLLAPKIVALKAAGLSSLTLSIDAADPTIYTEIRGGRLDVVLHGLASAREVDVPVRINMVLMRHNLPQLPGMMELGRHFGASLKLLDVMDLQRPGAKSFWEREFVDFSEVRDTLEELGGRFHGYESAPGGVGAPLLEYRMPDGLQVVLKDSRLGGHYGQTCEGCRFFPCQDALISIRVTHDGHLKRCLMRNDNLVDVLSPLRAGDYAGVRMRVEESFDIMTSSVLHPALWRPPRRN